MYNFESCLADLNSEVDRVMREDNMSVFTIIIIVI